MSDNNRVCFTTAFYHAEGQSPNIKHVASTEKKFDKYYQCIIVLFASIRRFHPQARLIIFSDKYIAAQYNDLLDYYGIETVIIPHEEIKYETSKNIQNKHPGCLFTLDVIHFFNKSGLKNDFDLMYILDSDMVMANNMDKSSKYLIEEGKMTGLVIDYSLEHLSNAQSRTSLTTIFNSYNNVKTSAEDFKYFGGEILALPTEKVSLLSDEIESIMTYLSTHIEQYGNEYTEEHVLSLILNTLKDEIELSDNLAKRIWTTDAFSNVVGDENKYGFCHFPAEKDRFFLSVFKEVSKNKKFLSSPDKLEYDKIIMQPILLILNPPLKKIFIDFLKKIKHSIDRFMQ